MAKKNVFLWKHFCIFEKKITVTFYEIQKALHF